MDGILNLFKPAGPTSHDIVADVRRLLRTRRVGHAGTLDPPAQGVLVVCVGVATRLVEFIAQQEKEYLAECRFGVATDTLDAAGQVVATADASHLNSETLAATLPRFTGKILQTPPMYSALRYHGERLYDLARRGEQVSRTPRTVVVHEIQLLEFVPGTLAQAMLRVTCSKGTYVRALCADLGAALGVPAHLGALTRTAVGPFRVTDAVSLERLAGAAASTEGTGDLLAHGIVLPPVAAVAHLPRVALSDSQLVRIRKGNAVPAAFSDTVGPVRLESEGGSLVGIGHYEQRAGAWYLQPDKILLP